MPELRPEPAFLPLTVASASTAARSLVDPPVRASALVVQRKAESANSAAADCWTALLAGCDTPGRRALPGKLKDLSEATSVYAGTDWWFGTGSNHRRKVAGAQARIEDAIRSGDGEQFAEAFIGYDQAVAAAVVRIQSRLGSPAL
ncbi:hypothetical protein EV191_101222 [Tamaricihabitans halophyticus]|uniref:Uncharacterized protein n=1 Tax=Tamaricihabitans halophyticus TaxID=1262583 RepID=A0A4R2R9D7_9PSEU|nr:hypothetical protein [Tamaricihabitans halophyticus]TCP56281.1 hypothetical protein EV191_101222 [Tamaricihabitans halophyticus]